MKKKQIGLWIDHRETIIVTLGEHGDETKRIESDRERYGRSSGKPGSGNSVLEEEKLGERIVAVKTENKMSDPQIAKKVRQHC